MRPARWTWQYLAAAGAILVAAGVVACMIAMTSQLLPYDEAFLGMTARDLCGLHACRIVHFMVHDRISFGGSVISVGSLYLWLATGPSAGERCGRSSPCSCLVSSDSQAS
jgi:hypothetical protein